MRVQVMVESYEPMAIPNRYALQRQTVLVEDAVGERVKLTDRPPLFEKGSEVVRAMLVRTDSLAILVNMSDGGYGYTTSARVEGRKILTVHNYALRVVCQLLIYEVPEPVVAPARVLEQVPGASFRRFLLEYDPKEE